MKTKQKERKAPRNLRIYGATQAQIAVAKKISFPEYDLAIRKDIKSIEDVVMKANSVADDERKAFHALWDLFSMVDIIQAGNNSEKIEVAFVRTREGSRVEKLILKMLTSE